MALVHTPETIMQLRRLVNDTEAPYTYSDEVLDQYLIDNDGNLNKSASQVWYAKASQLSTQVDISEAGSSRKNSDLFKNAMALAKQFDADDGIPAPDEVVAPSTTRRIVRW